MKKAMPVRAVMCGTCPWQEGSKLAALREPFTKDALHASRECHSTGTNAVGGRTGKRPLICRGARNTQLAACAAIGIITEPTDEAWAAQCRVIGMEPPEIVHEIVANKALQRDTKGGL